jgi:hypothetical protein
MRSSDPAAILGRLTFTRRLLLAVLGGFLTLTNKPATRGAQITQMEAQRAFLMQRVPRSLMP